MRVRVAAIVVHDDHVLLVSTRRGRAGRLVPPGGGVEPGEWLAEAVEREVREEAGLAVQAGPLLAYRELATSSGPALELYFAAELLPEQDAPEAMEGRQIRWVSREELPDVPHYPAQLAELLSAPVPPVGGLCLERADLTAGGGEDE